MATFSVTPDQLGAIYAAHARDMPKVVRLGLRAGVERGRALVIRRTPVGIPPGAMRQAWAVFPWGQLGWKLDNSAPHAAIVEAGARPHPVSAEGVAAIREWVARVLPLVTTRRGPGRGKSGPRQLVRRKATAKERAESFDVNAEIDDVTQAIVWNIRHHGQKPRWIVKAVLDKLAQLARDEVSKAVGAYLERPPGGLEGVPPAGGR